MENESKHTSGPWNASSVFPSITAIRLGEPVHIADAFYNSFGRPCDPKTEGEAMANARLIATAPDGYELAKMILDPRYKLSNLPYDAAIQEKARAIISKAEGR